MSTQSGGPAEGLLERQGIAKHLLWGFVAVILFQTGNGLELSFYSGFLQSAKGLSSGQVATMTMAYGIVIAIASWFSGSLADAWGPRRVMMMGFGAWLIFELVFLWGGVTTGSYAVMVIGYALRGFGYPLFCYGFLAWVTMDTPEEHLGRGVGWFWFAQALGMGALSGFIAGPLIGAIGEMATLWTSFAFVVVGGLLAILLVRRPKELQTAAESGSTPSASETISGLIRGVTILKDYPKTGVGGVVRIINQAAFYGIPVFFAPYMTGDVGFSSAQWATIWGTLNLANVFANLVFGYIGDAFGRVRTVAWFGGLGCGIAVFLMWWFPSMWGANFAAEMIAGILFGIGLAAYVPLSAIMPLLVAPDRKGSAVAILNLGAGLSNFAGPALAPLAGPIGIGGLMIVYAALHVVGGGLTYALNPSKGNGNEPGAGTGTPESTPASPEPVSQ
ncbi:MFS transporter [Acidipropionibacterium acidipropionici]|jgi:polyol permease family|uniref:Alpha-ketoglutarate permease n=1 Tax=Acidipropionibacterium acidipropionici TaxID=1748 RepID=A0AAC8YGZ1_9ACTN|nr:MFS transporter [Acidipropionibacterium acidipropionici]AMS06225.1 alpha-ketoglutarate permease [Acidipropionibacterium acidipropionici]AOZ47682.1 alpha-ketoglutarate permease [Acidipropionibacterium acidipropionici]AZP38983.1 MFS transporter [Acidipropionibacterium acidipropionici]QCV95933.1 MFS transporter [Acidipropionibacterium acidipropionici]